MTQWKNFARIGRKLISGLKNPTYVNDDRAETLFQVKPQGLENAIKKSIANEDKAFVETSWADAMSSSSLKPKWGGHVYGRRIIDSRMIEIDASKEQVFSVLNRLGGETGWLYADWAWRARGWIDLLFGGVGTSRGRKWPDHLEVGHYLDWWRVEKINPNESLLLRAEMKVPGRAWLKFEIKPLKTNQSQLVQTAIFDPSGLTGLFYWYVLFIPHVIIFKGMLREIAKLSQKETPKAIEIQSEKSTS